MSASAVNHAGGTGVNYRICHLALDTIRAVGILNVLARRERAEAYPQRGRGAPGIFLTSASCSTSQQVIDFSGYKTAYPHLLGGLAHFSGGLSALIGRSFALDGPHKVRISGC